LIVKPLLQRPRDAAPVWRTQQKTIGGYQIAAVGLFGILDGNGELISTLPKGDVEPMIEDGRIKGGMIPKARAAIFALEHGVKKAHIIKGIVPHATILELFTDSGIGTEIV